MSKVTEWFPANVKPARVGWYERQYVPADVRCVCDWWNGQEWELGIQGDVRIGKALSFLPWRGLATRPSKRGKR